MKQPKPIDVKKLIRDVTKAEGGAKSQDIAQVGEVVKNTLCYLATADPIEVELTLRKYRINPAVPEPA